MRPRNREQIQGRQGNNEEQRKYLLAGEFLQYVLAGRIEDCYTVVARSYSIC